MGISGKCFGMASRAPPYHKHWRKKKSMFYFSTEQRHIIIIIIKIPQNCDAIVWEI
jgi:hypothetical protein